MRRVRTDAKIGMARRLRKSMTRSELFLWLRLKSRKAEGLVFRNQHPIGRYILDFYCPKAKLCIEVDGEVHLRADKAQRDTVRDAWIEEQGILVCRINADDLLANPDGTADAVVVKAWERISTLSAREEEPRPLPINGEGEDISYRPNAFQASVNALAFLNATSAVSPGL